jgi:hypothetical protein
VSTAFKASVSLPRRVHCRSSYNSLFTKCWTLRGQASEARVHLCGFRIEHKKSPTVPLGLRTNSLDAHQLRLLQRGYGPSNQYALLVLYLAVPENREQANRGQTFKSFSKSTVYFFTSTLL